MAELALTRIRKGAWRLCWSLHGRQQSLPALTNQDGTIGVTVAASPARAVAAASGLLLARRPVKATCPQAGGARGPGGGTFGSR